VLTCLAILLTQNIESFWRSAFTRRGAIDDFCVGYAAVQESFEERDAIKVMALMVFLCWHRCLVP
jgi:DHA1 family multidrug/chloramphenicol efflux transport protein-like MFS transporter